ncbi:hypothetical protein GOD68_30060 [Sinorhizobium medicae]|uniref:hypothetical protein n=1 Tax=Rhizobium meliloti TaxID=382 RepID=UPI00299EB5D7|nr:hypothetical protein [Sinorhizobium medicae]MDX0673416.1 hypothetical protein [Sinorhizobium medicae]MDX0710623.1 hypothetical protein [Sinorhizobium medicae]
MKRCLADGGGLLGLMASIAVEGAFIVGSALLFALTARSFGRRALPADLAIGAGLGLVIFLTLAQGFFVAFAPTNLFFAAIGVVLGTAVGVETDVLLIFSRSETARIDNSCSNVSRSIDRMSFTSVCLACFRLGIMSSFKSTRAKCQIGAHENRSKSAAMPVRDLLKSLSRTL